MTSGHISHAFIERRNVINMMSRQISHGKLQLVRLNDGKNGGGVLPLSVTGESEGVSEAS